jgi:uncharacterized membrane protein
MTTHRIVLVVHIATALLAIVGGALALRYPNGSRPHRRAGRAYVGGWLVFAATGLWLGATRSAISPFEILTVMGALCTLMGVISIRRKRALGALWRERHFRWMLRSYAFVIVATVNQLIVQTGLPNPPWLFWSLALSPFLILPPYVARLRARYPNAR